MIGLNPLDAFARQLLDLHDRGRKGLAYVYAIRDIFRTARKTPELLFLHDLVVYGERDLLVALAFVLDDDSSAQALTIGSLLNYAEQNRKEFVWLHSPEGREAMGDPKVVINEFLAKWRKWHQEVPCRDKLSIIRDKTLAHIDKSVVKGSATVPSIPFKELEEVLDGISQLGNEFMSLIGDRFIDARIHWIAPAEDLRHMTATFEAGIQRMEEDDRAFIESHDRILHTLGRSWLT